MEFSVGIILAATASLSASATGFDRDRAFYPTILIVIASCYGLFAIMGGSTRTLAVEALPMAAFFGIAVIGFKRSAWLVVIGLVAHAIFDFTHHHLIANSGVPIWWPGFCLAYDLTAGAYLTCLLLRARKRDKARQPPQTFLPD
jgi:hypothetical protein